MALGKRHDTLNITPLVKIDVRTGKITRCDREQSDGRWTTKNVDIPPDDFEMIPDLGDVQVGWMTFSGGRPNFKLVRAGADIGDPPDDGKDWKEGFKLRLLLINGNGSGDVRELTSTSKVLWQSLDELHDSYLEDCTRHKGKLPIVSVHEVVQVQTASGVFYRPSFEITGWRSRPAELMKGGQS
jgi:hypothetical protein